MIKNYDDYRFSKEAQERALRLIWVCNVCGHQYENYPGINEGGLCLVCDKGQYEQAGESYLG